jgi:hypothetical protein
VAIGVAISLPICIPVGVAIAVAIGVAVRVSIQTGRSGRICKINSGARVRVHDPNGIECDGEEVQEQQYWTGGEPMHRSI